MSQDVYHIPALLPETISALDIKPDGIYIDATYGGGGHSREILRNLGPDGRLLGFDQDPDAVAGAITDDCRFTMIHANFRYLSNFTRYFGIDSKVDGILADLGVSFHHFDEGERGFSFRFEGAPLDMRMNPSSPVTAAQLINTASPERLADILHLYGEIKNARRMADAIVAARAAAPITTTDRLAEVVEPLLGKGKGRKELAPVFQALRIEVNGEMDALRIFLESLAGAVRPGGRLAIITYHSLEDRMVKNYIRTGSVTGRNESSLTDIYGRIERPWEPLSSKPVTPGDDEVARNPRSRSAKLRIAVRNGSPQ